MRGSHARPFPALWVAVILLAALLPALCACAGVGEDSDRRGPEVRTTEILWDTYGVPHVFARNAEELFHAFGWAQAEAHGGLLLRLLGQARGRAAEYWGGEYLDSDRWTWTMGIPERADAWYEEQSPALRRYLDSFAAGINDYARRHPERIDDAVETVLPVMGQDLLAHAQRAVHFTFVAGPWTVEAARRRWSDARAGRAAGTGRPVSPPVGASRFRTRPPAASNAWAIGPSRSESGHAMLLANPHLPWSDLFIWFEAHLASPEIDAYGAALVGFPFLGIAFNDHLGWTHTVNAHDGADFYELALTEGGYRWDEGVRELETRRRILRVRQPDGRLAADTLLIRESIHGPLVAVDGERALALRVAGLDQAHLFQQYWQMARARDLEEFEAAVRRLQLPTFTVMYADRKGNILHLFGGRVPLRPPGDWDWSGVVPGDRSETLWTETHAYDDLPRVLNPATGWLQNANDPPWTTTFPSPLEADSFPPYMAPSEPLAPRSQRSARMLAEDASISFEEMVAYKHSTRMEVADRILDDLVASAAGRGELARRAAGVLGAWDRSADADSRGAVLFRAFWNEVETRRWPDGFFADPWDPERPLETPSGLADPAGAVRALEAAAGRVERGHGSLDVPWGEVNRLRRDGLDLLGNGGSGSLGIFRVVDYDEAEDGLRVAVGGDSFVAAVEFGDSVRARALIGYGNHSQRTSPHRTDQLRLFARQELRPVWRTRESIEAHVRRRERVEPEAGAAAPPVETEAAAGRAVRSPGTGDGEPDGGT